MRNEEEFISKCLDSVLFNDYPHEKLEILVIDGNSTDQSVDIVRKYVNKYPFIRLLNNPKIITPAAMNIGIREAKGDIIIWLSAHAIYDRNYIKNSIRLLKETGAASVGGVLEPVGGTYISKSIAVGLSSPFGVGDAHYRYATKNQWVDTVFGGTWYKKTLVGIGGFNEEWVVNQDYELNYRLRQNGGGIYLSPSISCRYFVRDSLSKLFKQYFRYGMWKVKTLVAFPDSIRWRQLAPPLLLIGLMVSSILFYLGVNLWWIIPFAYLSACVGVSFSIATRMGFAFFPLVPVVFIILHLSWGTGFYVGIIRFGMPRIKLKTVWRDVLNIFYSTFPHRKL